MADQRSFRLDDNLLTCLVNCCTVALSNMGVDDSLWLSATIDLKQVVMMKESAEDNGDELGSRTSVLLMTGGSLLINIDFRTAIELWKSWPTHSTKP